MIYTALDTFYVSEEQLRESPSRKDGVSEEIEGMLRLYGCELIQESGILLRLPQAVMATGQVLFHRFYCKKSFTRFNVKRVAASCLWLASKLEESPRKIKEVLIVFHRMECRREGYPLVLLDTLSKAYEEMKLDLIRTERHLLKEMAFICHVEHPHKFVFNYLLLLRAPPEVVQEGWNLTNDSLRTTLCVRFKSEVVACGIVYAAARRFGFPLPENPPWWLVFQAEKSDIDVVCKALASLYRQPKAHYMEVSKESKSFVLASSSWDPPAQAVNGDAPAPVLVPSVQELTSGELKEPSGKDEEPCTNGDRKGESGGENPGSGGSTEKTKETKEKDKERGRDREWHRLESRERERDRERDRDKEKDRERDRDRDRERDRRDRNRDRDQDRDRDRERKERYRKESRRDSSSRHHRSSDRDRDRHRHHPY